MSQTFDLPLKKPADFSLVLGGPLYQIWRRTSLCGDALQMLRRRVVVLMTLAWVPLFLLSMAEGRAWGESIALPFLYDFEQHLRFLVALPLLIVAELIVHARMRNVVQQFAERGLIPEADRGTFDAAITSSMRWRNSIWAEILLIAFVYIVGVGYLWRTQIALDVAGWHGAPVNGTWQVSMAGWWLGCISLPLFQFLLLRWYFRFAIWGRFLWKVSRIKLMLMPTHPDHCGGLGFLATISQAFWPLLLAQGALLAGMMANRIFYTGAQLPEFKVELIGLVSLLVLAVLGPLLVFSQQLMAAKRIGLREYGALAQRYVLEYDRKWLRGGAPPDEPLIGSADIQSLADLGNSFEVVKDMRFVPFTWLNAVQLAVTSLVPVAPLLLTTISLQELLERLLQLLF